MKLKQLLNSSSLLIGLTLVLVAVLAKRETINGATSKAISKVIFNDDNYAEKYTVYEGSIYDGDTLRLIGNNEELKELNALFLQRFLLINIYHNDN
ncbi:MAG: hypothetical protein AB4206_19035 [Xenococcaceae cyanobacterium]